MDHNQRGTARARGRLAGSAFSRKIASAVALTRVPRESRVCIGARSWHVAPRSCTEGERAPAGAVPFHKTWVDHNQHGTAHARG